MYPQTFQLHLERVVSTYEKKHESKPSLLKISRTDYNALLPHESPAARRGLSIRGVTVIGFDDVDAGAYHLLP